MIQLKVVIVNPYCLCSLLTFSQTMLNCIDNSGATIVECVANLRMKRHGRIGEQYLQVIMYRWPTNVPKVIAS